MEPVNETSLLWQEMIKQKVEFSVTTYNALLDAAGSMHCFSQLHDTGKPGDVTSRVRISFVVVGSKMRTKP